ncbi:uncharacterized protein LOC113466275 [Diaphorina citri]|uniref:Uncharacterized protein LOC113466275 n=1 Tax=Diaphorina citri TaxID=121845 RepID=A0A3Q0IM33_DIACI|nr:uncharacterized protein LOC113466275 [Diaphorina citri]
MDAKLKRQLAQDALEESSMDISLDEIKFARAEDMEEIDEMEVGQEDEEVEGEESLTVLLNNKEAPANMENVDLQQDCFSERTLITSLEDRYFYPIWYDPRSFTNIILVADLLIEG